MLTKFSRWRLPDRTTKPIALRVLFPAACGKKPCSPVSDQCARVRCRPSSISISHYDCREGSTTTTPSTLRATITRFPPRNGRPSPSCTIQAPNSGCSRSLQRPFGPLFSGLSRFDPLSTFEQARILLLYRRRQGNILRLIVPRTCDSINE